MNPRCRLLIAAIAIMVGALAPLVSSGLQAQSAAVSRDLFDAFLRTSVTADSQSTIDFVEGRVASQLESYVHLPATVHVLGTVVVGHSSYVLGTSTLAPDSVVRAITATYRDAHWDMLSSVTTAMILPANGVVPVPQGGGFRPAMSQTSALYCHDSTEVRAAATHGTNATTVRVYVTSGSNNPCGRLPRLGAGARAPRPPTLAQPILPLLINPPNANQDIQCFNIGMRSNTANTQMLTAMDLPNLLDVYGKQLETQGWSATAIEAPMLRKIWSRRDSTGRTQTATLVVSVAPNAPMCRDASLIISTPTR